MFYKIVRSKRGANKCRCFCLEQTLECFVYVVLRYPVAYLAHYPCELQGGELTVFEHCDHLCIVEPMFLELEDYKVLGVGDYPPAGFFTFLD